MKLSEEQHKSKKKMTSKRRKSNGMTARRVQENKNAVLRGPDPETDVPKKARRERERERERREEKRREEKRREEKRREEKRKEKKRRDRPTAKRSLEQVSNASIHIHTRQTPMCKQDRTLNTQRLGWVGIRYRAVVWYLYIPDCRRH